MQFTPDIVGPYLTRKLGKECVVTAIEKFGRGTSRETWFVSFRSADGEQRLVFRRDPVSGSVDYTPLSQEFFMYRQLGKTSVPVAKALWWEDDAALTSRPFYVREQVEGSWNVAHFKDPSPEFDELRIRISREHMRKLALVHSVDWKALSFDQHLFVAPNLEQCTVAYIDSIAASFEALRIEPLPIFLEAVEWLKARAPVAPKICLCKGTNGLGEEIFRGEEMVAMSDWEEAHIGDPSADFAFMQEFAPTVVRNGETVWSMQHAIDYYRSVGGADVTLASVQFYGLVRALRSVVYSHHSVIALHDDPRAPIRYGWTATEVLHFSKHILAFAMGMMPSPDPNYMAELNTSVENAK